MKKQIHVNLGIKVGTKRDPVDDKNNVLIDTKPKEVIDFEGQERTILKLENKILEEQLDKKDQEFASVREQLEESTQSIASLQEIIDSIQEQLDKKDQELAKLHEEIQSNSALPQAPVMCPNQVAWRDVKKQTDAKNRKLKDAKKEKDRKKDLPPKNYKALGNKLK